MTRYILSIFLFAVLLLGPPPTTAQTPQQDHNFSLHMIPTETNRETQNRRQRVRSNRFGGTIMVMAQRGSNLENGQIVFQQNFQDQEVLLAVHNQLQIELFGGDYDQCVTIDNEKPKLNRRPKGPVSAAGGKGTNSLPPGYGDGWSGSGGGGCGTWATAMCNRILGKAKGAVTKAEWNKIAKGIKQSDSGGSTATNRAAYYKSLGCASSTSTFSGTQEAYEEMQKKLKQGYDVKLRFRKIVPHWFFGGFWNSYENGHVETVTGVKTVGGKLVAETNSWGKTATISGGNKNSFGHSQQGAGGHFGAGTWPAGSTKVEVTYIGPCK